MAEDHDENHDVSDDLSDARVVRMVPRPDRPARVTLRALRFAVEMTEGELAEASGIALADVSGLEKKASLDDCLVSTLRRHAAAIGGDLAIVLVRPDGRRSEIVGATASE
ncbi:MAG TPA: hypothetical protein VH062_34045 [Polyangiaceae bacterium]|jgi:hypothetical protein|nr:hypothetical protein [Polyangiaceae bacterium]